MEPLQRPLWTARWTTDVPLWMIGSRRWTSPGRAFERRWRPVGVGEP